MDTNKIKLLVAKFYNGETTIEEEELIYNYFINSEIAEELEKEREYFMQFNRVHEVPFPENLTTGIDNIFNRLEQKEQADRKRKKLWLWAASIASVIILIIFAIYFPDKNYTEDNILADADTSWIKTNQPLVTEQILTDTIPAPPNIDKPEITDKKPENEQQIKQQKKTKKPDKQKNEISKEEYEKMKLALQLVSTNIDKGLNQLQLISENINQTEEYINKQKY